MQENQIALFQKFGLAKENSFNYSESLNSFIGNGYTSLAGNTYLNSLRLVEGILVKEDVGHGYAYSFINGIKIFDLKTKNLLCEKNYHCSYYSQSFIQEEVISMLFELMTKSADNEHIYIDQSEIRVQIESIVSKAFRQDQRQLLISQTQKYLNK